MMGSDTPFTASRDRRIAVALALFLLAVYLFTSRLAYTSLDEVSLYLVARNLLVRGWPDGEALFGLRAAMGPGAMTAPGVDGLQYVVKDSGPALLALPLAWAGRVLGVSPVRTVFLLMPLVTALSAALLYGFIRRLGFRPAVAALGALTFGLGSLAWPYAGTFFGQPLVALGLLLALIGTIRAQETDRWPPALLAGAGIGLAASSAAPAVIAGLAHALVLVPWEKLRGPERASALRRALPLLAALALGAAPFGLALAGYNLLRFGSPLPGQVINAPGLGGEPLFALRYLPQGLFGQLLSAPRGVLWYAPFSLLALPGLIIGWRSEQRRALLLAAGQAGLLLLFYSSYVFWNGGQAWGPRHMVGLMPALALLAVPLLAQAVEGQWRGLRAAVAVLLIVSLLTQLSASLWYDHALEAARFFSTDSTYGPVMLAALLDFSLLPQADAFSGETSRVWVLLWQRSAGPDPLLLGAGLVVVAACGLAAAFVLRQPAHRRAPVLLWGQALLIAALFALMVARYPELKRRDRGLGDLAAALEVQADPAQDAVLFILPDTYMAWIGTYEGRALDIGLPLEAPLSADTAARLEAARRDFGRVWLVTEGDTSGNPASGVERWLTEEAYCGSPDWYEAYYRALPCLFGDLQTPQPVGQAFGAGEIVLAAAAYEAAGDHVLVWLRWQAAAPLTEDYHVFVHLLDASGQPAAQADGPPAAGFKPLNTWEPGIPVDDRRHLTLPPDLPAGRYTLTVGLYDWIGGERLALAGSPADSLVIGEIAIGENGSGLPHPSPAALAAASRMVYER